MKRVVALFGEAERGDFKKPHFMKKLPQLMERLGNPPEESEGLFFAIQALLYNREVIYFRVEEEGFSYPDYFNGLKYLANNEEVKELHALCLPGVGAPEILEASQKILKFHNGILITSQKDLYDFLTSSFQE